MSKYFRVRRNGRGSVLVDHDGKPLSPDQMKTIANEIIETVDAPDYVYFGIRESDGLHKIGRSNDPERRAKEWGIEVYHTIQCDRFGKRASSKIETQFHEFFKLTGCHDHDEFFDLDLADQILVQSFDDVGSVAGLGLCKRIWIYFRDKNPSLILEASMLVRLYFEGTKWQHNAAMWYMYSSYLHTANDTEKAFWYGILCEPKDADWIAKIFTD